eukprot:403355071
MKRVSIKELIPKHKIVIDPRRHLLAQQVYDLNDIQAIKFTHREPQNFTDKFALRTVGLMEVIMNALTGKDHQKRTTTQWYNRFIFLEALGIVPGLVAGTAKHLRSLSSMKPDRAMIHLLLEEAENERTHLFLFMNLRKPGMLIKFGIAAKQFLLWNIFFISYLISPYYVHRFVGYMEEESIFNYTMFLKQIDSGNLKELQNMEAPQLAKDYYNLPADAKFRDMVLSIRADESLHREFNHYFCELSKKDEVDKLNVDDINLDVSHVRFQENPEPTK